MNGIDLTPFTNREEEERRRMTFHESGKSLYRTQGKRRYVINNT